MTKTKRSKSSSSRMLAIAAAVSGVRPSLQFTVPLGVTVPAGWFGRGASMRIAFWMIVRRAQDCAQPRNTWLAVTQSSKPETKHSSAFAGSAVSKNESKCILSISTRNTRQNSALVAYNCDVSGEIDLLPRIVSFVLSTLHRARASTRISVSAVSV